MLNEHKLTAFVFSAFKQEQIRKCLFSTHLSHQKSKSMKEIIDFVLTYKLIEDISGCFHFRMRSHFKSKPIFWGLVIDVQGFN